MKYLQKRPNVKYLWIGLFCFISFIFTNQAFAIKIEPAKVEIDAGPGNIVRDVMKVTNDEPEVKTLYSSVELFEARGETGTPFFNPEKRGLSRWAEIQSEVTLSPGETREIPYSISIPTDAEPGGHFAAIFWSSSPPSGGSSQVVIGAKLGMLVLLRVSGPISEEGGIIESGVSKKIPVYSGIPAKIFYRFQNNGSDRLKPVGEIKVKNILGLTVTKIDANITQGNILPSSVRRFEVIWNKRSNEPNLTDNNNQTENKPEGFFGKVKHQFSNFLFGPYKIVTDLQYGAENLINTSDSFWVFFFPWQLLIIILALVTIIIVGFKRYNKWLIKKTLNSQNTKNV